MCPIPIFPDLRTRLGKIGLGNLPIDRVASPHQSGFRTRAKFRIMRRSDGEIVEGMDPQRGHLPVDQMLWILPEWSRLCIQKTISILSCHASQAPVDGFDVRLSHGRHQLHVSLNVKRSSRRDYRPLALELVETVREIIGAAVPSKRLEFGEIFLQHRLLRTDIVSHYRAFFQPNLHLTPVLLQDMKQKAVKIQADRIIDLYCGVGLFSLILKKKHWTIKGFDSDRWAVQSARKNARQFEIDPECFLCMKTEEAVKNLDFKSSDLVIVDPPRQGCSADVIDAIASGECREVCLVSCHLETQIRDLQEWVKCGFEVQSFRAYDAFPFTRFFETVCFLKKRR